MSARLRHSEPVASGALQVTTPPSRWLARRSQSRRADAGQRELHAHDGSVSPADGAIADAVDRLRARTLTKVPVTATRKPNALPTASGTTSHGGAAAWPHPNQPAAKPPSATA